MKKILKPAALLVLCAALFSTACSKITLKPTTAASTSTTVVQTSETTEPSESEMPSVSSEEPEKKSNDIVILVTSDVHCSPQKGFGYAGLYRLRERLRKEGCEVLLVDDGDETEGHGELFGTVTQGFQVIELMNKMGYDLAIPGNHDFVYGPDRFMQLTKLAKYPYLSCNITKNGKLLLKPYIIKEVRGKKIAFVGATTPRALGFYNSKSLFMNGNGNVVYDFKDGRKGKNLNTAIQNTVNSAREAGADYVFLVSHIGQAKKYKDYENIEHVIAHTKWIDAVLDGHSHDARREVFVNAEGKPVTRIGIGSKLSRIGYVRISGEDGSVDVGLYNWTSSVSAAELFGIKNEMSEEVDKAFEKYNETFYGKQGTSKVLLSINDLEKQDEEGNPIKLIDRIETNLGDFAADAFRAGTGADVAFIPGDKFANSLDPGDVSMKDMYNVLPYSRKIIVVKATGEQILDALEWSCRKYPRQNDDFLQVSGITFKVDMSIKSGVKSKNGRFKEVKGKRRVTNVRIGGQPIDPEKEYTVASYIGLIRVSKNGYNMFKKCKRVKTDGRLDFQILTDYLKNNLKGEIGERYLKSAGRISSV